MIHLAFLALLALTWPLAHLVGWLVSRNARVAPGHIREAMPSLPSAPPLEGRAERRWDRRLAQVERRLLDRFEGGAEGVEAHQLAAQLGEDPVVVDAVLARMREEISCRMRITQRGRIFQDFAAEDIAALRARRRSSLPRRLLLMALAAMANIGAAWPALSVAGIASMSLLGMAAAAEDEVLATGVAGLIAASVLVVGTLVAGFVAQLLFTPLRGPRLGDVIESEARPQRSHLARSDDGLYWTLVGTSDAPLNDYGGSSFWFWGGGSSSSSSSSSSSGSSFDIDDDAGEGLLIILVVILLLMILAAALSVIFIWLRGIWRAIRRLDEPRADTSPTLWVRTTDVIDRWEKFLPTNDLVIRTLHALKRFFDHRRPTDADLAARVLVLARSNDGVASALDIALREGLDMSEASEVGARLCGLLGGHIMVSDAGELAFAFPQRLLAEIASTPDEDMWAEYLEFDDRERPLRRASQRARSLPVNLVGLTRGHLLASDRLVAGTYIMASMGIAVFAGFLTEAGAPQVIGALISVALVAMALGTASLNATARYTAREAAAQGVRRDMRRAVFKRVRAALARGEDHVDLGGLGERLTELFEPAWRWIDEEMARREIRGAVIDLELEPSVEHPGGEVYDLAPLRQRRASLEHLSAAFEEEAMTFDFDQEGEDEVIFDTRIEHAGVNALGRI